MQVGSLVYVNARIKSLESALLTDMQLARLIDSSSLDEAFKILQEVGYGGGVSVDDCYKYEQLLDAEERVAVDFLKENIVPKQGLEAFLIRYDYLNAKALVKAKFLKLENTDFLMSPEGNIDIATLRDSIYGEKYDDLPAILREALENIDVFCVEHGVNPRYIDITLDKAMYKQIFALLSKTKSDILPKYFVANVDFVNIDTFLRARKLGQSPKFFTENFIAGGELNLQLFEEAYEQSDEFFKEKIKYTPYNDVVSKAFEENGLVKYETAYDNFLLEMLHGYRNDMFSVAPIAGFYLAKITELKVVRLVITCIKNKVDRQLLNERLRELYA